MAGSAFIGGGGVVYAEDTGLQDTKDSYVQAFKAQKSSAQSLKTSLNSYKDNVTKIKSDLSGINDAQYAEKVQQLSAKADTVLGKINGFISQCESIIGSYESIINKIPGAANINALMDIVNKDGTAVDTKLSDLNSSVNDVVDDLNTLSNDYSNLTGQREEDKTLRQLKTYYRQMYRDSYLSPLNDMRQDLLDIKNEVSEASKRLNKLLPNLKDQKFITKANKVINETTKILSEVDALTATCDGLIVKFQTLITDIGTQSLDALENIESTNESLLSDYSAFYTEYYDMYDTYGKFKTDYEEFKNDMSAKLNDQLSDLSTDVNKIMNDLNKAYSQVQQAINELDQRISQCDAMVISGADPEPASTSAMMAAAKEERKKMKALGDKMDTILSTLEDLLNEIYNITDANDLAKIDALKSKINDASAVAAGLITEFNGLKADYNTFIGAYDAFLTTKRNAILAMKADIDAQMEKLYGEMEQLAQGHEQKGNDQKKQAAMLQALAAIVGLASPQLAAILQAMAALMGAEGDDNKDQAREAQKELNQIKMSRLQQKLSQIMGIIGQITYMGTPNDISASLGFDQQFFQNVLNYLDQMQTWISSMQADLSTWSASTTQTNAANSGSTDAADDVAATYNGSDITNYQNGVHSDINAASKP